jgi:hypothetical protein
MYTSGMKLENSSLEAWLKQEKACNNALTSNSSTAKKKVRNKTTQLQSSNLVLAKLNIHMVED